MSLAGKFSAEDTVTEVSISVFSVVLPETVLSTQAAIWQMQATGPGEHKPETVVISANLEGHWKNCVLLYH